MVSDKELLKDFILERDHPCVMSQSIVSSGNYRLQTYKNLGTEATARNLLEDLRTYLDQYDFESNDFFSFIAVFEEPQPMSELEFEQLLWKQLQLAYNLDSSEWDREVSEDPKSSSFSFSLLGNAFYIVGMHPNSSRTARRSPKPIMVFNLHWQFERLRKMGAYNRLRNTIRQRDIRKNGSVNPMLVDFGKSSEAKQYSGRAVGPDWECPFKPK